MSGRKGRRRHIPQRTCVGCRQILPKRSMIRIVRNSDGIRVDPTGKAPGRGAYLHNLRSCWEKALQGSLSHALRSELTEETRAELSAWANELTDEQLD